MDTTGRDCISVAPRRLDSAANFSPRRVSITIEPSVAARVDTTGYSFNRPSTLNFEPFKSEQTRLNSFYSTDCPWPVDFISPTDCAKAGFFFLKDGDKVQCAFCRGVAGEWDEGDIPAAEHRKHFPRCPFICNLPVGNIPISQAEQEDATSRLHDEPPPVPQSYGFDVCGPFDPPTDTGAYTNADAENRVHIRRALPLTADKEDVATSLAIKTGKGPVRKNLVTVEARLKTFTEWPKTTGQSPATMADAGFFYIGTSDHVKCFYCDGGLRNWEESDDPWHEHALWFGSCPYVLLIKGRDYIEKVIASKPLQKPKSSVSSQSEDEDTPSASGLSSGVEDLATGSESPSSSTSDIGSGSESDEEVKKDSRKISESQPKASAKLSDETKSQKADGHDLIEELRQLKEARQCKICMDCEVGVVFLPCGHFVSCVRCATALSTCALCREPIKAVVRTYLS